MAENHHSEIFSDTACLSLEQMERYIADTLPDKERQAFEKHLVDCHLCSDALDGLSFTGIGTDTHARIDSLHARIARETQKRTAGFWKREYTAYAAAIAGIVLVSGLLINYLKTAELTNNKLLSEDVVQLPQGDGKDKSHTPEERPAASSGEKRDNLQNIETKTATGGIVNDGVRQDASEEAGAAPKEQSGDAFYRMADEREKQGAVATGMSAAGKAEEGRPVLLPAQQNERAKAVQDTDKSSAAALKSETSVVQRSLEYDNAATLGDEAVATEAPVEPEMAPAIDREPLFPGGEEQLKKFLEDHLVYPESAGKLGIDGKVQVAFTVNADSTISDVKVEHPIGGGCDEEALRVVRQMPKWAPAVQDGQAVTRRREISVDCGPAK